MTNIEEAHIEQARSSKGGWSKKQLAILEVAWPPKKGWKKKVIGLEISESKLSKFIALSDKHL